MNELITHCKRGHEFTEENTRYKTINGKQSTRRECVQCRRLRDQERDARAAAVQAGEADAPLCITCHEKPAYGRYKRCEDCRAERDRESPYALDESMWVYSKSRQCMVYMGRVG